MQQISVCTNFMNILKQGHLGVDDPRVHPQTPRHISKRHRVFTGGVGSETRARLEECDNRHRKCKQNKPEVPTYTYTKSTIV